MGNMRIEGNALESSLERSFVYFWRVLGDGLPDPVREYRFCPPRRYRFDFAWVEQRVAVEIQGGVNQLRGGRHNTDADRWKMAEACALGWIVFAFSGSMLNTDPNRCIELVRKQLCKLENEV